MATAVAERAIAPSRPRARRALGRVALAAVLANSTWFSATAIVPALQREWGLTSAGAAWLVVAVQAGFITGSVAAALLNLPDRVELRRLIAGSAIAAAAANLALVAAGGPWAAIPARFLVGVALAGVYAPGVRLVATHYVRGRGVATGVVVGALTLGSATPHLVRGLGDVPWQATIVATSALALLAAAVIRPVMAGPDARAAPPLDLGAAVRALRDRPVRLTTFGYLGHMWELYAFWAWLPAFFMASRRAAVGMDPARLETGAVVFAAVGVAGLAGAVLAGRLADRIGRTTTTSAAMVVSAACCLASPLAFAASTAVLVVVLLRVGRVGHRRLGAVLGIGDRARRADLRRFGPDAAARPRIHADHRQHPTRAGGRRRDRLALRAAAAGRRAAGRHRRDAAPAAPAGGAAARGRAALRIRC